MLARTQVLWCSKKLFYRCVAMNSLDVIFVVSKQFYKVTLFDITR